MKISKLFHYLYATLMFLPIMFFLPSCIYYGFNEHANANITQDTNVILKQLVKNGKPINEYDDIVYAEGYNVEAYIIDGKLQVLMNDSVNFIVGGNVEIDNIIYCKGNLLIENGTSYFDLNLVSDNSGEFNIFFSTFGNNTLLNYSYYITASSNVYSPYLNFNTDDQTYVQFSNIQLFNLSAIFGSGNEPTKEEFESYLTLPYYEYGVDYEITISKGYNISDSINEAWIHVWDLPFFAWTKNSFISQPFTYITGLFGLAANNPLNYIITWFASVSIIWLCFDVVMYLPNLAHRWLDKGAIS